MSQPGYQYLKISRSKFNQAMKFGQLIEYNMRKSYTKSGGDTIPRHFSKKIKIEHISGSII